MRVAQIRDGAAAGKGSRSTYYGRLAWDRPAYTISTYFNRPGNGSYIHPSADRLITLREAARLQSFPDRIQFLGAGRKPYIQIGNAVPPLMAQSVGRELAAGTFVDVFSGAGGLSLGLRWAGHELIAAADHDSSAIETLNASHGVDAGSVVDLSNADEQSRWVRHIRDRLGRRHLDTLVGGPPCQGFSTAGFGRASDPRNQLVYSFIDLVSALLPSKVIMENVVALMFKGRRGVLDDIRAMLHSLGYETEWAILHAEGYGVPQLRRRLFVIATRGEPIRWPRPTHRIIPPAHLTLQPHVGASNDAAPTVTVRDAIGDLPSGTASSLDETLPYPGSAQTTYQRWLRGETVGAKSASNLGQLEFAMRPIE